MGFTKQIEKPSGIIFNYHRINTITIQTNMQNSIELSSYITKQKRQDEVDCYVRQVAGDGAAEGNVLIEATYFSTPYDPAMTIDSAYEYLLTLPEFEGAEMEDTEYMLDAIETVLDIEAELAQAEPESEPAEEGGE